MILHACEMLGGLWPCLSCVGRFLPLLALLVIFGVVQRCLFFTWRYLALLAFAGVACRSCPLPFANALSVLLLARSGEMGSTPPGGWVGGLGVERSFCVFFDNCASMGKRNAFSTYYFSGEFKDCFFTDINFSHTDF